MSEYIVTARKYRPLKFEDVAGQEHVTTTLRRAIAGRRLAHAYLFSGPRGVGKTTTARLLAKSVNCLAPVEANPDNTCENCREITEGRSFDVIEIDGASNRGVEEIRNLRESVRYAPAKGRYRVYIIDEVHMLTKEAFNALLKTLEEPPPHILFIFATTEIHKVPATILSRCQRFDFRRITIDKIVENLKTVAHAEHLQIDDDALLLVAKRGDGSLRDAQSIFDQVVSLCGATVNYQEILQALNIVDQEVYFRVTDLIKTRNTTGALVLVGELMEQGHDLREFLGGLIEHFRNLMIVKETGETIMIEASDVYRKRYAEDAAVFTVTDLLRFQRFVSGTEAAIRWSSQPRFKLEADLVQLVSMQRAPDVAEILAGIDALKKKASELPAPSGMRGTAPHGTTHAERSASVPDQLPEPSAVSAAPERTRSVVASAEVAARWDEFVGEIRRQRISLGSVLESTHFLGVQGQTVKIGCKNDFQVSSIVRNKEGLAEVFGKMFRTRARIEAVLEAANEDASSSHTPAEEDHPVIAALKRELGAEPV